MNRQYHYSVLMMCLITKVAIADDFFDEIFVNGQKDQTPFADKAISVSKTPTDILHLPQSVRVLNRTLLDAQDNQTLSEALTNVSGVSGISPSETLIADYRLRGFDAYLYYDQMPAFGQSPASDPESMINVERIEVVKGPTSTLFGGGTGAGTGGLLNIVTKSPEFEAHYRLGGRIGSHDTFNPYVDINQPLNDNIALRLTGSYQEAESHIDDVESRRWSINPSLAVRFSERSDLVLKAQRSNLEYREFPGIPAIGSSERASYEIARERFPGAGDTPLSRVENTLFTGRWNYVINDNLTFNIAGRFYDSEAAEYSSNPSPDLTASIADTLALLGLGTPFDPTTDSVYAVSNGRLFTDTGQLNINANLVHRFNLGGIRHQILWGLEIDETDNDSQLLSDTYCNVLNATLSLFSDPLNPLLQSQYLTVVGDVPYIDLADNDSEVDFGPQPSIACFGEQDFTYETLGFYVQDQMALGERWHIDMGLRWTNIQSDESDVADSTLEDRSPDNDKVTGRFGISYALNDEISLFAGYGQGFQAPIGVALADQSTPEPSESESWEVGLKWRASNGFSGNLAYFDLTRTNIATTDPANPGFRVQVGEQRSEGVELDFLWQLSPQWLLLGNMAHLNAEVVRDNSLREGESLARVPESSGRLSLRYEFAGALAGLAVQVGGTYHGEQEITLPNTFAVDAYSVFDTQVSYTWSNVLVRLSLRNLTDKEYFNPHGFLGLPVVEPGAERAAYLSLDFRF